MPSFYETALRSFERFPAAQFFLGSTLDISTQGRLISAAAQHWPDKEFYSPEEGVLLTIAHYFNWTGAVYRKEAVQKHRLDPRVEAIDYDWILRLSALYPFTLSKKPCASFVHHEGSYSNQCGLKLLWPSFSYSSQTLHKLIAPTHHPDLQKTLLATLHRKLFRMFVLTSVKKNWAELQKVCEIAAHQGLFMHRTFPCLAWTLQQVPFFHALCMKFLSLYRFCKRSHLQWSLKRFT